MSQKSSRVPWVFWAIGGFALLWNVLGCINFIMQMNTEMLASMPDSHREIAESRPFWASVAFVVSVFGGAIGSILLLLRNKLARYVLIAAFVGVAVTMTQAFGAAVSTFSTTEMILAVVMPIVLAAFLIWYSGLSESRGWIN